MTPEAQRIAIAEACPDLWAASGWKWSSGYLVSAEQMRTVDPLNSLDAMHEAEKGLTTAAQQNRYHSEIADTTWSNPETGYRQVVFNQLTATAAQRAEAFLRTLTLWKP